MDGGVRAARLARAIAGPLLAAVLLASVQPCPTPLGPAAGQPGAAHASHASHTSAGASVDPSASSAHEHCSRPATSLRAPCTCGCAGTPGTDASPSRLPLALLAAGAFVATPLAPLAPDAAGDTLPESPRQTIEHVPLRPSA
jgi:MYXO-CTERM domain-containing protein